MLRRLTMIIGVCGQNGAGKSTVCDVLQSKGFSIISLSDEIRAELMRSALPETRDNLIKVGNELRTNFGAGVLSERVAARLLPTQNYAIDSIRHPSEVKALQSTGRFRLIAVKAPAELRFSRLRERGRVGDVKTLDEFLRADELEQAHPDPLGQQLRATMALSDVTLDNDTQSVSAFRTRVESAVEALLCARPAETASTAAAAAGAAATAAREYPAAQVPEYLFEYFEREALPRLRADVHAMRAAAAAGDESGVRQPAHRIRGSAASFGLTEVDRVVQEILNRTRPYIELTDELGVIVDTLRYEQKAEDDEDSEEDA